MSLYRKKPVVVEARSFDGTKANAQELCAWIGGRSQPSRDLEAPPHYTIMIPTLEGHMWASAGDWVIQGVKGEFYPCRPDIFEETYEAVA